MTAPSRAGAGAPGMDLSAVRRDLVEIMFDTKHDDGSFAPLFIRLAWHLCGTYDAKTRTGGCNGCTMQFKAEQADPENAGLAKARELLEPLAERYKSSLSKADLFVLAAYVGLECADGPCVRFRTGRKDFSWQEAVAANGLSGCPFGDGSATNPTGSRLPAADRGKTTVGQAGSGWGEMEKSEAATIAGVRGVFHRLGFDDRETVALVLFGHQFGRMHAHLSGYEGAWYASSPAVWSSSGPGTTTRGYGFLDVFGTKWADYKEVQV
eukprot:SAG31_NODE_51_length_30464_cov_16.835628_20_plen_266_part_00